MRVADLFDREALRARIGGLLAEHNRRLVEWYGEAPLTVEGILAEVEPLAERLRPYARPVVRLLYDAVKRGEPILFEGAQGTFLDVDHGTYPFVTSSQHASRAARRRAPASARPPSTR